VITKAMFDGICGICVEAIRAGEEITKIDDEWCHEACARDEGYLEDES
jgi:hypothetical protein